MKRRGLFDRTLVLPLAVVMLIGIYGALGELAAPTGHPAAQVATAKQPPSLRTLGGLPLSFEPNRGQTDPRVRFLARGPGYTLFLTARGIVLALETPMDVTDQRVPAVGRPTSEQQVGREANSRLLAPAVLRMELVGANPAPGTEGLDTLPGESHYFIGNDPDKWTTHVPYFGRVRYREVYPGIGLVFYGNPAKAGQLEYDFIVAPGSDPNRIKLSFASQRDVRLDGEGNLVLSTAAGEVRQLRPQIYQELHGVRKEIAGRYEIKGRYVAFRVGPYDPTRPLIIDPVLIYSTYLGGSGYDQVRAVAADSAGNVYVTGVTKSRDFPVTAGAFDRRIDGQDVFVTKLNATGTALVYSTFLGGGFQDWGQGIAVDSSGNAYVTGFTEARNFPVTSGAFQSAKAGKSYTDAFITKLNDKGSALLYSSYLGGTNFEYGFGIALDSGGNAYVTGQTRSTNFPTTSAFQTALKGSADAFVAKINPSQAGSASLVYSTYLGGSSSDGGGRGIAVDSLGNAYVTGNTLSSDFPTTPGAFQTALKNCSEGCAADLFVTKLAASGSALIYSTFIGGDWAEVPNGIAVDSWGQAYVTGWTNSPNFPTTPGAFQTTPPAGETCGTDLNGNPFPCRDDAFVAALNNTGSGLIYSTYLGGHRNDYGNAIAVDPLGNAYVTGSTNSSNFPTTPDAFQPTLAAGSCGTDPCGNAFVTIVNSMGSALNFSTYLGGLGSDAGTGIALDSWGNAYVAGIADSTNFPTTPGAFQSAKPGDFDGFVVKLALGP